MSWHGCGVRVVTQICFDSRGVVLMKSSVIIITVLHRRLSSVPNCTRQKMQLGKRRREREREGAKRKGERQQVVGVKPSVAETELK